MRYILHPGYVQSKNDRDEHFISGQQLARLYGVDYMACVFGDVAGYREMEGDVHLWPRFDGNYSLPLKTGQ
jgi:hypothetical protein